METIRLILGLLAVLAIGIILVICFIVNEIIKVYEIIKKWNDNKRSVCHDEY